MLLTTVLLRGKKASAALLASKIPGYLRAIFHHWHSWSIMRMPRHNPVVQPVGLQHVVGWWSHLPHPKRRIVPLTSRFVSPTKDLSGLDMTMKHEWHHSTTIVDFFPTKMVKLHIRREKKQSSFLAISSEISIYSCFTCFTFNKKNTKYMTTFAREDGWIGWIGNVTKFRLKFTNPWFFKVKIAWNPRHCCAPNASWVSILSTASPAACRVWYILWNLLAPSTPLPKDHLLHDYPLLN